jgi:hypothetical protein
MPLEQLERPVELLTYNPSIQTSPDLEPATTTITAVAEPAVADYSTSLTVPAPADARIVLGRTGLRLKIVTDSMTAVTLNVRLYANGVSKILSTIIAPGTSYHTAELTSGQFGVGVATAYTLFLWVDAGNAVISEVILEQAVGNTDNGYNYNFCLQVIHNGFVQWQLETDRKGTGTAEMRIGMGTGNRPQCFQMSVGMYSVCYPPLQMCLNNGISFRPNTAGDLVHFFGNIKIGLK